jgi:hypothetical protein
MHAVLGKDAHWSEGFAAVVCLMHELMRSADRQIRMGHNQYMRMQGITRDAYLQLPVPGMHAVRTCMRANISSAFTAAPYLRYIWVCCHQQHGLAVQLVVHHQVTGGVTCKVQDAT